MREEEEEYGNESSKRSGRVKIGWDSGYSKLEVVVNL